jgi:hypothetical protein
MRRTLLLSMLWLLAGCAGSRINAQWSDPQFAGQPPRGAKVLVACQAADPTLRRVCADRMAAKLSALGAVPVLAPDNGDAASHRPTKRRCRRPHAVPRGGAAAHAARPRWLRRPGRRSASASAVGGGYRSGGGVGSGVGAAAVLARPRPAMRPPRRSPTWPAAG